MQSEHSANYYRAEGVYVTPTTGIQCNDEDVLQGTGGTVTLEERAEVTDMGDVGKCLRQDQPTGHVQILNQGVGRQQRRVPVGLSPSGGVSRTLSPGQDQSTLHSASVRGPHQLDLPRMALALKIPCPEKPLNAGQVGRLVPLEHAADTGHLLCPALTWLRASSPLAE